MNGRPSFQDCWSYPQDQKTSHQIISNPPARRVHRWPGAPRTDVTPNGTSGRAFRKLEHDARFARPINNFLL